MVKVIPDQVLEVYKALEENKFEAYFVGGSVRDLLLKRKIKDWDLTTNATPEQIVKVFPNGFYDNEFGTVGVPVKIGEEDHVVEITTYRTETAYKDNRHPEKVSWGKTLEEDLGRRDFTVNAIALRIGEKNVFELVDPYDGEKDLKQKIIRAVGDPNLRFKEDALRLLRAVRITTELGFTIEKKTWERIIEDAMLIENISAERIKTELLRILGSDNPYAGVMLLKDSGLLGFILPELLEGIGVSMVRPGRHHTTDVFTHNILSLKFCPSIDPLVRFATLLHDVGKPKVAARDEDGYVIFHNHEVAGARIAAAVCDRLKFSKKDKEKVVILIRWHMFSVNENQTDAAIRRFIRKIGVENVKEMMDLRVADRLGGGTQTAESWRLKLFKEKIEEQLKPAPFSINDMTVDGNDVMRILNIKPGPIIGKVLNELFAEVDEDLKLNNKEYLEKRIKELGTKI
ncbi:MAG TPA: HD domain-containing protein [Patescibacteria group bacterium]|jgi:putative nucleotidyltransferase with HDIG domain|nr:HD domain-containing protein [Patescibacteria group bacterium]